MAVKTRPCQRCKAEIPPERIEALPQTRLCVKCSREVGGDFVQRVVVNSTGKQGSLKKTGMDWRIVRRRRRIEPIGE
jgi:hypothetical protein